MRHAPASGVVARKLMVFAIVAAVIVGAVLAFLWWGQEKLVFFPQRPPYTDPGELRPIDYAASDKQPLRAFIVGDPDSARGVLLCFHGNADLAVGQGDWAREVARRTGYAVMLAEYRGYMGLGGEPTYAATVLDAEAAYRALRDSLGIDASRIAYFGHSLGAAVAAELALRHEPRALLLQAPFTSARDMARRMMITKPAALAWGLISRVHYDPRSAVARISAPVWVSHGHLDGIIPVDMGRAVFAAAKTKGGLLVIQSAGHNDVADAGGEEYWKWVEQALAN